MLRTRLTSAVCLVAAAAAAESIVDVRAWARLYDTGMARSSDMVRRPKSAAEGATPVIEGTTCLLLLMLVIWRSWLDERLPVSGSYACCARGSSFGSSFLNLPYRQRRHVGWCHCVSSLVPRRDPPSDRQRFLELLGADDPGRRRGGGSCRPGPQSHGQLLGAGGPGC